ncbi:MAG: YHS domain-containing protein [Leptolyngbyaceae cyanobacterium MAG.088]|nr:YHS domain-containing protein [Leptolyngbyaceae cyanobacterium MAG.088]
MIRKQAFNAASVSSYVVLVGLLIGITSCSPQNDGSSNVAGDQPSLVQTAPATTKLVHMNLDEEGIALRGYDPVSYFTEGAPAKGQKTFSLIWNEATWYFATAENRGLFKRDPEKYAPANGGYCTFGIVLRKKFDGDPQVWSVIKSRLYVFLNKEVQQKFLQDSTGNLQKVSKNWPIIQFEPSEEL